jgi:hypothetical protein
MCISVSLVIEFFFGGSKVNKYRQKLDIILEKVEFLKIIRNDILNCTGSRFHSIKIIII